MAKEDKTLGYIAVIGAGLIATALLIRSLFQPAQAQPSPSPQPQPTPSTSNIMFTFQDRAKIPTVNSVSMIITDNNGNLILSETDMPLETYQGYFYKGVIYYQYQLVWALNETLSGGYYHFKFFIHYKDGNLEPVSYWVQIPSQYGSVIIGTIAPYPFGQFESGKILFVYPKAV